MSTTLAVFISRLARDLHENPAIFPPGGHNLWTLAEILDYIDYAERDFLRRTGILKSDITVPVLPGNTILFNKPAAVMDIERISFNYKRLRRVTTWDLEREDPGWRVRPNGTPRAYHEDHLPATQFEFDHIPAPGGSYRMFCDSLPAEHTTNLAELIAVNDCWEPYIRWEVIALALGKDGDNQDVARSAYAHQRYLLGVALALRLVNGENIATLPGA